jgi:hypothetical protein
VLAAGGRKFGGIVAANGEMRECQSAAPMNESRFTWNAIDFANRPFHVKLAGDEIDAIYLIAFHVKPQRRALTRGKARRLEAVDTIGVIPAD